MYLLITKMLGRKVVYQIHGGYLPMEFCNNNSMIEWLIKKMLSMPDVVVLLTQAEYGQYRDFAQIRQLEVIPNAIDLSEFEGFMPRSYDSAVINLAYIGRLVEEKGVQDTLKALVILRERRGLMIFTLPLQGRGHSKPFKTDCYRARVGARGDISGYGFW